jgi:hypothetical protein
MFKYDIPSDIEEEEEPAISSVILEKSKAKEIFFFVNKCFIAKL